jgi:hypothetical protein
LGGVHRPVVQVPETAGGFDVVDCDFIPTFVPVNLGLVAVAHIGFVPERGEIEFDFTEGQGGEG